MTHSPSSEKWRAALESWAIPDSILAQPKEDPWALPVALFEALPKATLTRSHRRALEVLRRNDDVLDVGAGRCAMSLPLRPPASRIIAVDGRAEMLENSPADVTVLGRWPDVASQAGQAAVVVCGHVLYNVQDLPPFIRALNAAARHRVVLEITQSHPRNRALEHELWRHFWGLERPTGPTWADAVAVIRECGIEPQTERWESEQRGGFENLEDLATWMRRSVCLDASRDEEVRAIVMRHTMQRDGRWLMSTEPRLLTTIWWDVPRS